MLVATCGNTSGPYRLTGPARKYLRLAAQEAAEGQADLAEKYEAALSCGESGEASLAATAIEQQHRRCRRTSQDG